MPVKPLKLGTWDMAKCTSGFLFSLVSRTQLELRVSATEAKSKNTSKLMSLTQADGRRSMEHGQGFGHFLAFVFHSFYFFLFFVARMAGVHTTR